MNTKFAIRRSRKVSKKTSRQREMRPLGMETLEKRDMLSALGIAPDFPLVAYNSTGVTTYNATTDALDVTATPIAFLEGPPSPTTPPRFVLPARSFEMHMEVDDTGTLVGGVAGDDLILTGSIDLDGDSIVDVSGTLLTGEISEFGYENFGTTDFFDYRFTPTGGAFLTGGTLSGGGTWGPFYSGKDIAVTSTVEGSTFEGDFSVDFSGGAKGNIGETDSTELPVNAGIHIEKQVRETASPGGGEGLTPGYWKQSHHFDDWTTHSPTDNYNDTFMVNDDSSLTLLGALQRGGGGNEALGRHAVAAILNAANSNIDYDLTLSEIKTAVMDAYTSGDFEPLKDQLDGLNNQGADLMTPATTGTPGPWLDADSPTGPIVDVGGEVEFQFLVTNTGDVAIDITSLIDDTFSPIFVSGDTDSDGLLDTNEEWVYNLAAPITVSAGQHVNTATATGNAVDENGNDLPGVPDVMDSDSAHWFGDDGNSLSVVEGIAWEDSDNDGEVDFGEQGIAGVMVELTGSDDQGQAVNLVTFTDSDGLYIFVDLQASDANGYMIEETQPVGYDDGMDTVGDVNGTPTGFVDGNDKFSGVVLGAGEDGINYNFGEIVQGAAGGFLTEGQTATIGFWHNKNGQALIEGLNGGASDTQLSAWLATEFPNLYGANSGSNDLTGSTNAEVADYYTSMFKAKKINAKKGGTNGAAKLDPQVMAVAFAVYSTDTDLAGNNGAAGYGFITSTEGTGSALIDIDGSIGAGTAETLFGAGTSSVLSVLEILQKTDEASLDGVIFADGDGLGDITISTFENLQRSLLNMLMTSINEDGDI